MTKAELIEFLKPFADETRITVNRFEFMDDAIPSYHIVGKDPASESDEAKLGLTEGEGYIEL